MLNILLYVIVLIVDAMEPDGKGTLTDPVGPSQAELGQNDRNSVAVAVPFEAIKWATSPVVVPLDGSSGFEDLFILNHIQSADRLRFCGHRHGDSECIDTELRGRTLSGHRSRTILIGSIVPIELVRCIVLIEISE